LELLSPYCTKNSKKSVHSAQVSITEKAPVTYQMQSIHAKMPYYENIDAVAEEAEIIISPSRSEEI